MDFQFIHVDFKGFVGAQDFVHLHTIQIHLFFSAFSVSLRPEINRPCIEHTTAGKLRISDVGSQVTLSGWVQRRGIWGA